MPADLTESYDHTEAQRILNLAVGGLAVFNKTKAAKAYPLLKSLAVTKAPDGSQLVWSEDSGSAILKLNGVRVAVWFEDGAFLINVLTEMDGRQPVRVVLPFNAATRAFESKEIDRSLAPEPGKPFPLRSPLAVLMEAAVKVAIEPEVVDQ